MRKAIFLDRDGTINTYKEHIFKIEDFEFINGMPEAIKKWNDLNYLIIVITNQAGIGRGLYTEADVSILHKYINEELSKIGAHIDAFYFCPHHPEHGLGEYKKECNCRKPKTGLFEQAISDYQIDIDSSFLFGDKEWDIEAGEKVGLKSFMVDGAPFDVNKFSFIK